MNILNNSLGFGRRLFCPLQSRVEKVFALCDGKTFRIYKLDYQRLDDDR